MNTMPPLKCRPCSPVARFAGRSVLWLMGWRAAGRVPDSRDMVVIAAPHTSNWDFILLVAAAYSFGISINWLGKDSLFRTPVLGRVLQWFGGVPVDRSRANNMVEAMADRIRGGSGTTLVVPPSGTRRYTEYWKSGFYHIAHSAGIPLVCGYLDYEKKEAGLGPSFVPGDLHRDMDRIRDFYTPIAAKYPANKSRIRLKEEDPPTE